VADVHHFAIGPDDKYLILGTSGLLGLSHPEPIDRFAQELVDSIEGPKTFIWGKAKSLRILRRALGGSNLRAVSMQLTAESDVKWMEDTTITVMDLRQEWEVED
jgi:hypothetical protein